MKRVEVTWQARGGEAAPGHAEVVPLQSWTGYKGLSEKGKVMESAIQRWTARRKASK